LLDVIIVNFNSTNYLLRCVQSIYGNASRLGGEIYVQDNGSQDEAGRVVKHFPDVVLTMHGRNVGFAKAVNAAIKKSTAPYLLILNPDTYAAEGSLEDILDFMEGNPDVAIVGPKILNWDGSIQASARAHPTASTTLFGRSSLLSKWFPSNPWTKRNLLTANSNGSDPMDVDWVSGACMVVRRKAISDVGCLDERFFMYWEDADWCRRMWQKGWRVVYLPLCPFVHFVGGSSHARPTRSIVEFHKSVYRLFEKHNTRYPAIIKPLVIGGLALRLCAVMVMNGMRILMKRNR
jgi:GT2 family glycosyltransferase